jgi:hypothetical protein
MYIIRVHGTTVKRIISEIILNKTFLFMYVSSCGVYPILLSTSEIFSIISKNFLLLIIDMQTTAIILHMCVEIINKKAATNATCENSSVL